MLITRLDPAEAEWIAQFGAEAIAKQAPAQMGGADGGFDIDAAKELLLHPKTTITATERPSVLSLMRYLTQLGVAAAPDLQQLAETHTFYFVSLGLGIAAGESERVDHVDIAFDFSRNRDVAVHSMVPETRRRVEFTGSASGSLSVNESFQLREPDVSGNAKVALGFDFTWTRTKCQVVAIGAGTGRARWVLEDASMFPGQVALGVVLRVRKQRASKTVDFVISGGCRINRGYLWWKRQTPLVITSDAPVEVQLPEES